ncbi:unnamed protein product [Arctia plantaginis]|uniref:Uncharacterized protein n=1 Tax=Arctia plantaginis TaxID=874455 RepID=A0A8S0ZBN8_ARCPL|nr:unnamed protein product [Arctia plantaginis]
MALITKDKPLKLKFQLKSKELQKFFEIIIGLAAMYDMMAEQGVDKFYDGRGVVVHSNYRRYGIGYELLKNKGSEPPPPDKIVILTGKSHHQYRRLICQELGVPLTAALMTAYGTQKAAECDGWEIVSEYNFEEMGKQFNVTFDKKGSSNSKIDGSKGKTQ